MAPTLVVSTDRLPPPGTLDWGGGGDNEPRDQRQEWSLPSRTYRTGIVLAIAAIVMFFAALVSALVVRRGISTDWIAAPLPGLLWLNTTVLLVSSMMIELSRRALDRGRTAQFAAWLYVTAALGVTFLAGQLVAWRHLAAQGFYLATNPSSAFFYLLTAAHGVHLVAGVVALFYVLFRAGRIARGIDQRTALDVTRIFWHFLAGLWLLIFLMLRG